MNLGCRGSGWNHTDRKKGPKKIQDRNGGSERCDAMLRPAGRPSRPCAGALHIKNTRCQKNEMVMKGRRASLGEAERRDKLRGGDVEKEKPRSSCPLSSASLHPVCIQSASAHAGVCLLLRVHIRSVSGVDANANCVVCICISAYPHPFHPRHPPSSTRWGMVDAADASKIVNL